MTATAIAVAAIVIPAMLVIAGTIWRLGSKIGSLTEKLSGMDARVVRLEDHVEAHDRWHLNRGDR